MRTLGLVISLGDVRGREWRGKGVAIEREKVSSLRGMRCSREQRIYGGGNREGSKWGRIIGKTESTGMLKMFVR